MNHSRKTKATEPPVAKRRGRPPKRRRKEDETVDPKSVSEAKKTVPTALIGRYVLKEFRKKVPCLGKVVSYDTGFYRVIYEKKCRHDELKSMEIRRILVNDDCFGDNDDLNKRKSKLDELILAKLELEEKSGNELNCDLPLEKEEESNVMDVDSSGDSKEDYCFDPEIPLPLELPPSSGTIGVPEQYVSHLFAVYGFLRSFSTRLFLSPFTLDDFVGALNCKVLNTLLDAVHVSLMRALRRHLENLSAEGSKIASKCLRCNEWSLIDTMTWPVFVIQYLAVNGYIKGSEWKGFYDELFCGEYYVLPASRKLIILQILVDDVLESEELKAEMSMREESEARMDCDVEDILPAENGLRKVHPRRAKTDGCKDDETSKFVSKLDAGNVPDNSEDDIDKNGDECRLCGMDGTLLCCDRCPATYHSRCIGVVKMYIPEGAWYCPECKINEIGPTIARGTFLKGAEIFGRDLYGQLFMATCDHLLVLNVSTGEFCLKYYNQNDIPEVIRVLYVSMQHRPIYSGICTAMLQYWNIPESFLDLCVPNGTCVRSENTKIDDNFSAALLPPVVDDDHRSVSLGMAEHGLTSVSGICSDHVVPPLDGSLVINSPVGEISGNAKNNVNMKLPWETGMDAVVSTTNHQSDIHYPNPVSRSTAANPAKYSLVSSQFINYGHANDTRLPMNLTLQTKGDQTGFQKCKGNIINDFVYMGCSYKPQSYINYYMHGDFAASAAANLAILSSEEPRSEGIVSENLRKATSGNTHMFAKAFSQTVSRFFWPSSDKKLGEVPRERCGWCLSCKTTFPSRKACMLNQAATSATRIAVKVLSSLPPVRSGEGIIPSIATYVIYMEKSLRGLIGGPFLIENCRRQWRKQVERTTSFNDIKPLLLKLEENIRTIAFCGDWLKLMDDWFVQSFTILSATSTVGTTQRRVPCGRRRKQLSIKTTADTCHENFAWWNGGKLTKSVFQKAVLPKSMAKKAARRGGLKKILGIFYPDGSEIPKRSRQMIWRAAVQMSRNASQLALQVRYLDFHIRWNGLTRPEHTLQDGKGQDTEVSAFRNANICDKKLVEGNLSYGIDFGSQKHLPSRVMKNVETEQGPDGTKYWFSETRIPLYLIKEYEVGNGKALSHEGYSNISSQSHRRRFKDTCKDIFFYLTCKIDKGDPLPCSVCQLDVLFRNATKCSACQGYCHEGCSVCSTHSTCKEVELLTTCKQCYLTRSLTHKETSKDTPTRDLPLQGQEHTPLTFLKGPRPKCSDQVPNSSSTKDRRPDMKQAASASPLETKSHRKSSSWGIIWKKKNIEDTGIDFRVRNILLKRRSSLPQLEPVCRLCHKLYRSDLMYICCETCKNWYHADAVELEESKIFDVLGFKCCKCRKIKSPVCPYSDLMCKEQGGKKSQSRASKREHGGVDSDSGTLTDMRACEPAPAIFPAEDVSRQENDPMLFSLANVSGADSDSGKLNDMRACEPAPPIFPAEDVSRQQNDPLLLSPSNVKLLKEPMLDAGAECNAVSAPVLQNSPMKRHDVKPEGHSDGSVGGEVLRAEFSLQPEVGNLPKTAEEVLSPFAEFDDAVFDDCNLLNDSEIVNNEYMEFEPHSNFSLTEILHPDSSSPFEESDVPGDFIGRFEESDVPVNFSGQVKNSCTLGASKEYAAASLVHNLDPTTSSQENVNKCRQCSQVEQAPDLSCQICGMWIHSKCSPWIESSSRLGAWRCGDCRDWQ